MNSSRDGTFACPTCNTTKGRVLDSRFRKTYRYRRRQCINGHKFSTIELIKKFKTTKYIPE